MQFSATQAGGDHTVALKWFAVESAEPQTEL